MTTGAEDGEPLSAGVPNVDAENPWLGLASFTEETRAYFHGREEEVAELARRVQRKRLTLLFGQSGLGKTSILRAGLVPRLRDEKYCPVYVRVDYGADSPAPAEQIKQAIAQTARGSGEWTQVGVAEEGESLWEFLHHRDDVLRDESGATLIPLLIFDQFEEIFTLGQSDDFGRARAARFVEDLADLVENRPPKSLEARLEADESAAERFDFARGDYRVLIALREDYLAPLEGLKAAMPSITQNRLRLAPMTGQQALAAVTGAGGQLVSEEVAAAIVRFIAGGAELANAEVEPSLLSLICRELNDTRIAEGRSEISLDLLDGSRTTILGNFYERALADQPPAVRRVIEDELLTASGFRENVAEERMRTSLADAGAAPDALATLVNRRLLRIDERLDLRRVELTHDVLCSVVMASRDLRHEREALEATERLLGEQKARELAARAALVRARQVAGVCLVLALLAAGAAGFAYLSTQRARRAEQAAQETRLAAERARSEAEHLLGYLNDDFATELEGFGRLSLVLQLGQRELDYYNALPAELQTTDTIRSRALAAVRFGIAQQLQAHLAEAQATLTDATNALRKLRAGGDKSEGTAIGLSLGLGGLGDVADRSGKTGLPFAVESEQILRPYFDAPKASAAVRRTYGLMAENVGTYRGMDGAADFERARHAFASLGARELSDIQAAADYAQTTAYASDIPFRRGDDAALKALATEGEAVSARVLEIRPGHLVALRAHAASLGYLSTPAANSMHLSESIALIERSTVDEALLVRLDPTNADDREAFEFHCRVIGLQLAGMGKARAAVPKLREAIDVLRGDTTPGPNNLNARLLDALILTRLEAELGDAAAVRTALGEAQSILERIHREREAGSSLTTNADALFALRQAELAMLAGDSKDARALAIGAAERLSRMVVKADQLKMYVADLKVRAATLRAEAEYSLGDFAEALESARAGVELTRDPPRMRINDKLAGAQPVVIEAMALARLGRTADAAKILAPVLAMQHDYYARNHDFESQRFDYATALFAESLAEPAKRATSLAEANRVLHALPAEMQTLGSVRRWQQRVTSELAARPGSSRPSG